MDNTLHVLVSKLLNCQNEQVSDKDTKLDVLAILANLVSTITKARADKIVILGDGVCVSYAWYIHCKPTRAHKKKVVHSSDRVQDVVWSSI